MSNLDSADLLSRLRDACDLPATDEALTDARGYTLLSDAQVEVTALLAQHIPWVMYTAAVQMTTSDNIVFSLSSGAWVGKIEVTPSLGGYPWVEGVNWDSGSDFTMEGESSIRRTGNRTYTGTLPYVRYVPKPTVISASVQPTLKPSEALLAVVQIAAAKYHRQGGYRDPKPALQEAHAILWGRNDGPFSGSPGLIPAYKSMQASDGTLDRPWYYGIGT